MSSGVVLESIGTYTYRTPYYQLSGAQDYKPGMWSAQVQAWQATIDRTAFVFTSYPCRGWLADLMDGPWIGSWLPRATFHKNVGIIQYWRPELPLIDAVLFADNTHAYFKKSAFNQVVEQGHWVVGRKGQAYLALYSLNSTVWSSQNDYELIAHGRENVWIVEMGDSEQYGSFQSFVDAITSATVVIDNQVIYKSPSLGEIIVGREGSMTVGGALVNLGPYPRWDNQYSFQEYGTNVTQISFDEQQLELDFATPRRRYWAD